MTRHVVVVGAGPAGLAAAGAALRAGARVTVLDAADTPGGQYHRMLPAAYRARRPGRLHHGWRAFARRRAMLEDPRCAWRPETGVWALEPAAPGAPPRVHVLTGPADGTDRARDVLDADALVLATGAHDRVLPFPGWQLPGVFTAGAAQALAKGERVAVGRRVVVAGTGPFLLPVAAALLDAGACVPAVLEANRAGTLVRGWTRRPSELVSQAGKLGELGEYLAGQLRGRVPYRTGHAVVAARGDGRVEEIVTARLRADWSVLPGSERTVAVDAVCVGHGFTPALELPVAAGCAIGDTGFVTVDAAQRSTVAGVYAAGEITGIAGAPAAVAEGTVAGWCAAGGGADAVAAARRRAGAGRAFARRLARAHPIGSAWSGWLRDDTVVCRCEETPYAALRRAGADPARGDPRAAKLVTRAGLGPCQGRVCGPTVAELATRLGGASPGTAGTHRRPVATPIRLGELASPERRQDKENQA